MQNMKGCSDMDDILSSIAVLLGIASLIFMIGTAGALDQDLITFAVATKRIIVAGIIFLVAVGAGNHLLSDKEDKYDRL